MFPSTSKLPARGRPDAGGGKANVIALPYRQPNRWSYGLMAAGDETALEEELE